MFITFEGGEGCGKSTHAKLLTKYLKEQGHDVVLTREPGATNFGREIRHILLNGNNEISAQAEMLLIAADRTVHVNEIIKPALKNGKIVISDRYIDSSVAYQVGGRGLPAKLVSELNKISSEGLIPDLTLFLDVSVETGFKRIQNTFRKIDRFEKEAMEFHEKVNKTYKKIAAENKNRIVKIDSSETLEKVQASIQKVVAEKLSEKSKS